MRINPEFRRNVWLQITWPRLLAAPLVTVIACYAYLLISDRDYAKLEGIAELVGGGIIVGLLGTRRAADSLAEEVSGGTWESQRMSGLGAWGMTWGKLMGSTAFVWYCAAIALTVVFWCSNRIAQSGGVGRRPFDVLFDFTVGGLMAQAAAFAIALVLMRKAAQFRRLTITLAQSCGFLLYFFAVRGGFAAPSVSHFQSEGLGFSGAVDWYGRTYALADVRVAAIEVACVWAVIGAYRLMRTELQYRNLPWVWALFVAFVVVVAAGFQPAPQLALALLVTVLLTYIAFFADHRDPVRYRWALLALRGRDWFQAAVTIPWWLISYLVAAALAGLIAAFAPAPEMAPLDQAAPPALQMAMLAVQHLPTSLALLLLFMLRDLLVLLWLSCSPLRARADVAGIIYLALVYWPLAAVLWVSGGLKLLPVAAPIATGVPAVDYVPIAIELVFALLLFYARWREITRLRPARR